MQTLHILTPSTAEVWCGVPALLSVEKLTSKMVGWEGHDPKTPCLANLFSLMHDIKIVVGLEKQELTVLGKPF